MVSFVSDDDGAKCDCGVTIARLKGLGFELDNDEFHANVHGTLPYETLKLDPPSMSQSKIVSTNAGKADDVAKDPSRLGLEECFDGVICFETFDRPIEANKGIGDSGESDCRGIFFVATDKIRRRDGWIMDSACPYHICMHREWFVTYTHIRDRVIYMGNHARCTVVGIGAVRIRMFDGVVMTISKVWHVPDMKANLISLGRLDAKGFRYSSADGSMKVMKGCLVVMKAKLSDMLYILEGSIVTSSAASDLYSTRLWHLRLGHMSEYNMAKLSERGLLDGLSLEKLAFCKNCVPDKTNRVRFKTAVLHTKGIVDYIHIDLFGPFHNLSHEGAKYILIFIDDYSRKVWTFFPNSKNYVFSYFDKWQDMIEKKTKKKIKSIRISNGLESCSSKFEEFCKNNEIVKYETDEHNEVAKQMNKTVLEIARCMLSDAVLLKSFRANAISTACYLINRSPHSALDYKTPEEVWSGSPFDYSNLRIFGCPAYTYVNERNKKYIFVGYASGVKGYKLWNPESSELLISRDVIFDESAILHPDHFF